MKDKRIYIRCSIANKEIIARIQKYFSKNILDFESSRKRDLHLTIFHYGKPKELYKEIHNENPLLEEKTFSKNLLHLVTSSKFLVEKINIENINPIGIFQIKPSIEENKIFGDKKDPVLVLALKESKPLNKIRKDLMDELENFLEECNVKNTASYISRSDNLKFQIEYKPHITIGRLSTEQIKLPKCDTKGIQIVLKKIDFIS